ncbi:hypothetical protein B7486_14005 [cyanobacterium TDX16]|nr:hypothetical protein B7486_14005 [cyanobacterium TDX16]
MKGDERVRYCEECRLNVYNFAELSRGQAEDLIRETEGRLCGIIYRRPDGTVLTRDCPVGLMAIRRGTARVIRFSSAACLVLCGVVLTVLGQSAAAQRVRFMEPFARVCNWLAPPLSVPMRGAVLLGDIALPVIPSVKPGEITIGATPQSGCNGD